MLNGGHLQRTCRELRGMRREGRVTGNLRISKRNSRAAKEQYAQEMQDLGSSGPYNFFDVDPIIKVLNKPTNESKCSGRCKRTACRGCHAAPPSKALSKTKGLRNKSWRRIWKPAHQHMNCPSLASLQDYVDAYSDVYYEGYEIHSDEDVYVTGVINEHQHEPGCDDDDDHDVNIHYPIMVRLGVLGDQQGSLQHHHSVESASQQPGLPHSPDRVVPCNHDNGSIEWCLIAHPEEEPGEDDSWILC